MKILSFLVKDRPSWGALITHGIVDLGRRTGFPDLRTALAADVLSALPEDLASEAPDHQLEELIFLPVIPDPKKIFCIGTNYHDHRIETGREVPAYPVVFTRFANSQVGHGQPLARPIVSEQFDFEGEIAVVIGRGGRRIAEEDAYAYIAGYAPYCDGTVRDWQRHTHQWIPGKNFPKTGGFGPWMVTRGEITDGADLTLLTRLNGAEVQRTQVSLMIFSIPKLIAYCSTFTELEPGDIIVTGTPGGVGGKRVPPLWMKDGDVLEVEVSQIGILRNPIKDEVA
ncbi:fumarylacetoacetate hydrolase family protein [Xanthobacter autotrophicus]|uniref:fumarylacetoacetate hydrolase family protein n=1 Tax=Xanthobacter autotrophicus TaxID=280 RepID=UPI00372BC5E3